MDSDQRKRSRLDALEPVSRSLSELARTDEAALALLVDLPPSGPADYVDLMHAARGRDGMSELRVEKRRRLLQIAAADAAGELQLEEATAALAALADACLQVTLDHIGAPASLGVVAMGKLGGAELNYVSDIDVMFVADSDQTEATKAAEALLAELGGHSPQGRAYVIDANLRPEGRSGALVRSVDSYLEYYERWAKPWEFQALLKARPSAGNLESAQELIDRTRALVFPSDVTSERVSSIRKMKERVEDHAARALRKAKGAPGADVKLGPGGIRDIEFCVQLLQLVHGSADESIRSRGTLDALQLLTAGGYVAEDDAAGLAVAYRWLRTVEHRLQLWQERRVHQIPSDDEARARFAKAMGFSDTPVAAASSRFDDRHRAVLADVRGRFERIFYRPMIESLAQGGTRRLSAAALQERLRVLGFRDVERAARNLQNLVAGTSRKAKLLRVLTPALLRFLANTPAPDAGLLSFLHLAEALGNRVDALGALRDNPPGLAFLSKVLGSGRLMGEVLVHVPEELHAIADPETLGGAKGREQLIREAVASLEWRDPEKRLDGLRRFKRREMMHVSLRDLAAEIDVHTVGTALSDLADAALHAALGDNSSLPFAVIGMGKLGGGELNYSSDIDVMFVHDGDPAEAEKIAEGLLRAVGEVTPEGQAFRVDAALRPEGKAGTLARSLESFLEYYERWAKPWEHQALIKARFAAGHADLAQRLLSALRPRAFPEELSTEALREMRHLKARMEKERVTRGVDPRKHLKMGPGGISDVEFAVQLLQRLHGHRVEQLRTRSTTRALDAARDGGLLSADDARVLLDAYSFLMRLRNRAFFLSGRPVDVLPAKPEELEALGISMGFRDQPRQELDEAYLRTTRRARRVAEGIIYS
jgi:[glutamine synthetase] adenylyltransferase / [glutamine synthetase]-adenylyl-L-tyrosine phosphorylase